jgi:hypothetical protein
MRILKSNEIDIIIENFQLNTWIFNVTTTYVAYKIEYLVWDTLESGSDVTRNVVVALLNNESNYP